jgi:nucleotide-binding universal stress UspA family protein
MTPPVQPTLICYDGSAGARNAIAVAAPLLRPGPAVVLHVWLPISHVVLWNPLIEGPGPLAEPAAELDEAGREAAERLAEEGATLARDAGFDAHAAIAETRHGAWRTILHEADERDAAVVVLGSHGLSPLASGRLGCVAAGVLHHARRPVLAVPAPTTR